ncbi:hypothetical protein [Streptomyces sp. NPDC086766]|uniref:hypothetical protein n=1 Tax=Streptomyces sp. NPDC086766 TaxID=3365754 RepID=UPI0038299A9E
MRPHSGWIIGCALAPTLLLTACTSHNDAEATHSPSPTATHQSTEAQAEKRLTAEVQSALDATTDKGSSMVESGVERVSDGVHTQPSLTQGKTYKLTVACAGKGTAEIVLTPSSAGEKKPVPCDQSVVFERIKPKASLRLDVVGKPGASGMVAWRINKV